MSANLPKPPHLRMPRPNFDPLSPTPPGVLPALGPVAALPACLEPGLESTAAAGLWTLLESTSPPRAQGWGRGGGGVGRAPLTEERRTEMQGSLKSSGTLWRVLAGRPRPERIDLENQSKATNKIKKQPNLVPPPGVSRRQGTEARPQEPARGHP